MKTKAQRIDAIMKRTAMDSDEKLDAIRKILDDAEDADAEGEEEETTAEGEEEETTAETEEDETSAEDEEETAAEGEEEEPAAEGEEEEEPKAKSKASAALARAKAILALPEAKGREALAQELAFTAGMSTATAKKLLAAAPKGSRLAGNVHDPKLGADGGRAASGASSEDEKAADFVRNCAAMANGKIVKTKT